MSGPGATSGGRRTRSRRVGDPDLVVLSTGEDLGRSGLGEESPDPRGRRLRSDPEVAQDLIAGPGNAEAIDRDHVVHPALPALGDAGLDRELGQRARQDALTVLA